MKKVKVVCMILLTVFLTSACEEKSYLEENANKTVIEDYEEINNDENIINEMKSKIVPYDRDNTPGKTVMITLDEMEQKIANKENFAIVFTTSLCSYCQSFHEILSDYNKNHHIVMYEVVLDQEEATIEQNSKIIHKYFQEFSTTPGIFYVENGKNKSYFDTYKYGIDKNIFDIWVQQNQIDKKN